MHQHDNPRSPAHSLPAVKKTPLPFFARYPFLHSLLIRLGKQASRYRYPIITATLILILYAVGQGFVAGAIACGAGLYLINTGVDRSFGKYLDKRGNRHVR